MSATTEPLDVVCPWCDVEAGEPCLNAYSGEPTLQPHPERRMLAKTGPKS